MNVIFDIESNGLLDTVTKIHCLVIRNADNGELILSCADQSGYNSISDGISYLQQVKGTIIGHNIDGYDLPVLKKIAWFTPSLFTFTDDTLPLSRLIFSNLWDKEIAMGKTEEELGYKHGAHSLEAWGVRLGVTKGDFGKDEEDKEKVFAEWSKEMQEYCEQDTLVNYYLYKTLKEIGAHPIATTTEQEFNKIMQTQMLNGIELNVDSAKRMDEELRKDMEKTQRWAEDNIKPAIIKLKTKEKVVPFNINSDAQVAEYFMTKYQWVPKLFTDKEKKPQINGDILAGLPYPEARIFADYHQRSKIVGFLSEGKNAWLKHVKDNGRLHGYVNSNGQVSGRVTMSRPNLGQVPSTSAFKGVECRGLFRAREGYSLVDCDAKGIQLRILGHYLYRYDGGEYAKEVVTGDPHTRNKEAALLPTRDIAKEWVYAMLFGAGQEKLGHIYNPLLSIPEKIAFGKKSKQAFMRNIPAMYDMLEDLKGVYNTKGYVTAIDGRLLYPREGYKSLATLFQGTETAIMKMANIIAYNELIKREVDFYQVAFVHDEILLEVKNGQESTAGEIVRKAIIEAGERLKMLIPLDGEFKIGPTWAEVH